MQEDILDPVELSIVKWGIGGMLAIFNMYIWAIVIAQFIKLH